MKSLTTAIYLIMISQLATAQVKVTELVKEWERSKAYTKEYLEAMPESGYSLKPTPEMRSFAEQNLHLADANYGLASSAMGIKSPFELGVWEKTGGKTKSEVSKIVLASYDFVISQIKKLTDAQLDESVKMIGSFDMAKRVALGKALEHQAHHRGQTTVYLRLAGVKPPDEKLF
nr:DinB family protein [uncultured Mucilaginibacter sp.]